MAGNIDISQENVIPIVFSCDDNYVQHLYCAITSIIRSKAASDNLKIFILIDKMLEKNKTLLRSLCENYDLKIEFIQINSEIFKDCPLTDFCKHISIATYYRFILASLLENFDKAIYLDCDITVQNSLKELYETDITNYYFGAVKDILFDDSSGRLSLEKYCNAGVMLINLKKWREENIQTKLFEWTAQNINKIKWVDQDVLNYVLQSGILYIDSKWNCQVGQYPLCYKLGFNKAAKKASILHYIGKTKPWMEEFTSTIKIPYLKNLLHTPFAKNIPNYILLQLLYPQKQFIRKVKILFYIFIGKGAL